MSYKRSRAAYEADDSRPPQHAPYALYGTPLPAFDPEARDDGSYVPIWKQEVTDERGRKRLHGAFTGGFSAGYFNTVGSKEGWTPSTFVSSRSARAQNAQSGKLQEQRPEDYMDDEDLAEQAESQKLETQHSFAGLGTSREASGVKGMFSDLFKTTGETKGVKLLQRMGWRKGQGIGPKIRRRAQGDKTGVTHLFAPENSPMIGFARKTDRKGLGFAGEGRLDDGYVANGQKEVDEDDDSGDDARILQTSRSKVKIKPKMKKKSGFGVGVLNDDGSDDDDPYAMGPRINYSRIVGADKKKRTGGLVASNASPSVVKPASSKMLARRTASTSNFRQCHDGRLPLDGFILATAALTITENMYPLPEVHPGWQPTKQGAPASIEDTQYQSTADAAKSSTLDIKSRADLLGEQSLPGKSIFDFMKPETRDRLAAASGKTNLPPALGESAPEGFVQSEAEKRRTLWDRVPPLAKETAVAALHRGSTGWMPYAEDEEKRSRYKYFLQLSAGLHSSLPERPKAFSLEEWAKELREFAEAAEIFKPVSGLMASRFTTSANVGPKLASDAPDATPKEAAKEEDPAEKAAKMGMYGSLTRSRQPFFPTRLLCKRFNVKPPANVSAGSCTDNGQRSSHGSERLDVVSQASLNKMMMEANFKSSSFVAGGTEGGSQQYSANLQQVQPSEVDIEQNDALEGQRAGEDVFRAIFGSDDEDDD